MSKSSLRKDTTKTVRTNLVISFDDTITLTVAQRPQTGNAIYVVPRKGEASFQRVLWTVVTNQNPTASFFVTFGIMNHQANQVLAINRLAFIQKCMVTQRQNWENLTSVGVVDTAKTIDVDMDELILSRSSNLQTDDDFEISPAYVSEGTNNFAQTGTMWIKEVLTQEIFRDDLDEWAGYTFEESAA